MTRQGRREDAKKEERRGMEERQAETREAWVDTDGKLPPGLVRNQARRRRQEAGRRRIEVYMSKGGSQDTSA